MTFDCLWNFKISLSASGFNDLDHRYHLLAETKLE